MKNEKEGLKLNSHLLDLLASTEAISSLLTNANQFQATRLHIRLPFHVI